jgi:indolepyruvate ferredoxin oxidoreductase beta subunit
VNTTVDSSTRTINMVAAALGGEGGGVFTNWVIEVADRENWLCQTTSLAGVAQRTGATIYYLELFPRGDGNGANPIMSLFPAQGDIDIAIVSEIAEAGRMVQRGFVSADRTTLIASDHRIYGISEKVELGDGTIDPVALQAIAGRYAKDYIHYDMLALANQYNAVISAVMLGGLAGSGVLPFSKHSYEAVIEAGGKAVATNMAAFRASYDKAQARGVESFTPAATSTAASTGFVLPAGTTVRGAQLLRRLEEFPVSCREILYHALEKLNDYQDYAYADQFLNELQQVLVLDQGEQDHLLTRETARYLALWMCYEDIPRVAQFKTRAARSGHIREEVKAEPGQHLHVTEFFRPRVEELCALLPPDLARAILNSGMCRRFLNLFTGGKQLRTDTITMFVVLRLLAGLRRWRRTGLGYQHEHAMIQRWLLAVKAAASRDQALAREIVECGRMVKGYGATRQRTTGQLLAILEHVEHCDALAASEIAGLRLAALADDDGAAFSASLEQARAA